MTPDDLWRTLYAACGLESIRPGMDDQRICFDWLQLMEPLHDTPTGPITRADITAVISSMKKARERGINYSIRPRNILNEPEKFRDMILEERRRRNLRRRKPSETADRTDGDTTHQVDHDPAAEADAVPVSEGVRKWMEDFKKGKA